MTAERLDPPFLMDPVLREALAGRDHSAAIAALKAMDRSKLPGRAVGDHAFLLAWSLLRAGKASEAVPLLDAARKAEHVPPDYLALTLAELLQADGQHLEAAKALEKLPKTSLLYPRAALVRATALREAGSTAEAKALWLELAARPDPAEGSDLALLNLALQAGIGSPEAYPYLRRIWSMYPKSDGARAAEGHLKSYTQAPTWQESALRGDQLMNRGDYSGAITLLAPLLPQVTKASPEACTLWYAYGRSLFKANRLSDAVAVLDPAGQKCKGHDDDRGAKSLYIAGKAQERKKAWGDAARLYKLIPTLYPSHSYADDGLAMAGIGLAETGDAEGARKLWAEQVRLYADGDLAAEGFWRLAWTAYQAGNTEEAIRWAEQATWEVPLAHDAEHLQGCLYWAARWRAYPDVKAPTTLTTDPKRKEEAIRLWIRLVELHPHSFYAMLAGGRLQELAPTQLKALPHPGRPDFKPFEVREAFLADPSASAGLALLRLGLYREGMAELNALDEEAFTPAEMALVIDRMWAANDWLIAHDRLRNYISSHPPELMGKQRDRVLARAYPETYWTEVKTATAGYSYDPRYFHALVREESNFNKDIVSHAGARGLSQLMPATARMVAGWMGTSVNNTTLFDPLTNLKIGARYLESLFLRYKGNPCLSLAGYNAGEGNVKAWLDRFGNVPTDEYVESIPFRETRGYVKRVLRSAQTYRLVYDEVPPFEGMAPYNHKALP